MFESQWAVDTGNIAWSEKDGRFAAVDEYEYGLRV